MVYLWLAVIFFWKILELNQVGADFTFVDLTLTYLQKFRLFLLDSEKSMILLAYLLTYGLEIKDKPRMYFVGGNP
jgi:hypothetical protein